MYPLTIAFAIENKELADMARAAIAELPVRIGVDQNEVGDLISFIERIEKARTDVVLVDVSKMKETMETVLRGIKNAPCDPMLIALHTSADPEMILKALRAGVNEYLFPPFADQLQAALERRSTERNRRSEGPKPGGRTVGFFSSKGGCGATTVACFVAAELGRQGQHVLLCDLDIDSGIVSFLMKAKSPYSVQDALNNLHRLDVSYWKALVTNGHPGLEIIGAPPNLAGRQEPRQEQVQYMVSFVRTQYDWTVIDLGRSINPRTVHALEEIDMACLVTTLDVPSLHQAKHIIQTLLDSGYGKERINLVLNRVPKRLDLTAEELEKMLGLPIYSMIPNDYPTLYECYSEGKLLARTSTLGKNMVRLTEKLADLQPEKGKKKFGLF